MGLSRRQQAWLAGATTAALLLLYVAEVVDWTQRSASWPHTDGIIHHGRIRIFAEALETGRAPAPLRSLVGYGPLVYVVTAALMVAEGSTDWVTGVHAQLLFATAGGAGTALVAARLGGPWCAPVATALLIGLPTWRAHTAALMVDLPAASLAVLAVGLLLWSDGLRRPWLTLGAGLVTGLALVTRWPVAFALAPAWVAAVPLAGWTATRRAGPVLAGTALVGVVTSAVVLGPLLLLDGPTFGTTRRSAALVVGVAGALLALVRPGRPADWWRRALGAGLGLGAVVLMVTLWAPVELVQAATLQTELEAGRASDGVPLPLPLGVRLLRALGVLATWQWGPVVTGGALLGLVLGLGRRARRAETGLVALAAACNLLAVVQLMVEPDERHVLAVLPLAVALAGAAPGLLPGRTAVRLAAASPLLLVGLAGLWSWRLPGAPGATDPALFRRDINLVREPWISPLRGTWAASGAPWASLPPYDGGPWLVIAEALHARLGDRDACIAWVIDDRFRDAVHLPDLVQRARGQLADTGVEVTAEDPYDRPGAVLSRYDGALVVAPAGDPLVARVQAVLPAAAILAQVELPEAQLTVLLNPDGWASAGCGERFPGTHLLGLGQGMDQSTEPLHWLR